MHERDFHKKRRGDYKAVGAVIFTCTGSVWQGAGWPDWWIGSRHFEGWLELKVGGNTCSEAQKKKMRDLRKVGAHAYVYRWRDGVETLETEDGVVLGELQGTPIDRLRRIALLADERTQEDMLS